MVPVAMTTGYQGTGGPLTQSDVGLYLFDRRTPALRDHHLYYIFPQNEVDGKFWPHIQATFPSSYMVWVQGSRCGTCNISSIFSLSSLGGHLLPGLLETVDGSALQTS